MSMERISTGRGAADLNQAGEPPGVYPDRTAGGHRGHCDSGQPALVGPQQGQGPGGIVACKSNLHQYGVGLRMYVDDYKAYPADPAALAFVQPLPDRAAWFQLLQPYTKDTWTNNVTWPGGRPTQPEPPGIQICPDYGHRGGQFLISNGINTSYGSYGYNCLGYDMEGNPYLLGLGVQWSSGSVRSSGVPVRDGDVVCPSDMIAIGDAIADRSRMAALRESAPLDRVYCAQA